MVSPYMTYFDLSKDDLYDYDYEEIDSNNGRIVLERIVEEKINDNQDKTWYKYKYILYNIEASKVDGTVNFGSMSHNEFWSFAELGDKADILKKAQFGNIFDRANEVTTMWDDKTWSIFFVKSFYAEFSNK
jgi:hypothetical protein